MKIALLRIKILLIWVLLLLFGTLVLGLFGIPSFIVGIISKFWKKKVGEGFDEFTVDLRNTNIVIDILGNVTIFNWLWFLFKTKGGYKFGNIKDTISFVLWMNKKNGTLKYLGEPLYSTINFFDKGHFNIFEKEL